MPGPRSDVLKTVMETVYDHKIAALESMIVNHAGDAGPVAACRTRIAKERGGIAVRRDAACQRTARHHVEGVLKALDRTPRSAPALYLAGCAFALGDVLWVVNLVRLAYLGFMSIWDDLLPPSRRIDAMASCVETAPA